MNPGIRLPGSDSVIMTWADDSISPDLNFLLCKIIRVTVFVTFYIRNILDNPHKNLKNTECLINGNSIRIDSLLHIPVCKQSFPLFLSITPFFQALDLRGSGPSYP